MVLSLLLKWLTVVEDIRPAGCLLEVKWLKANSSDLVVGM